MNPLECQLERSTGAQSLQAPTQARAAGSTEQPQLSAADSWKPAQVSGQPGMPLLMVKVRIQNIFQ